MIYYFTPYALDKNLGAAYNHYMQLLPNDEDWACFVDGDAMFLTPDFGHIIKNIVDKYPETGMFTCYTNRVANNAQLLNNKLFHISDIRRHRKIAADCKKRNRNGIKKLTDPISGVMMIINKKTWKNFRFKDGLLGVDNDISSQLISSGKDVLLIKGIYLLHYYRMNEGRQFKNHLK